MKWIYYTLTASVIWGLSYTICGKILLKISSITLITIEVIFGFLIFSLIFFYNNYDNELLIIINNKELLFLVSLKIIICIIGHYLSWQTLKIAPNPGIYALVEGIYPLFTILFSFVFFKVFNFNFFTVIGSICILSGVMLIRMSHKSNT